MEYNRQDFVNDLERAWLSAAADVPGWFMALDWRSAFGAVAGLPYVPEKIDSIRNPTTTIAAGGDCEDKALLLACWARGRLPVRFVVGRGDVRSGAVYHIFCELKTFAGELPLDATYPENLPGYYYSPIIYKGNWLA